jgi:hypothetical protein
MGTVTDIRSRRRRTVEEKNGRQTIAYSVRHYAKLSFTEQDVDLIDAAIVKVESLLRNDPGGDDGVVEALRDLSDDINTDIFEGWVTELPIYEVGALIFAVATLLDDPDWDHAVVRDLMGYLGYAHHGLALLDPPEDDEDDE